MNYYHRDPTVPFWRSNVDVDSLFTAHAHRPERAQAWLRFFDTSESTPAFEEVRIMRGHFEGAILGDHTYHWTFTPTYKGEPAIVLPVRECGRVVDILAIARGDHNVWGCCTGAGQFVGSTAVHRKNLNSPLRVYKTPINWLLLANCEGILPLSKSFFPLLQQASSIIAEGFEHAWEVAEYAFLAPAERLFLDCEAAEQAALNKISFEVAA
ncbi:hypothetical protein SAMN05443247_00078 [Bradyrhizobium erythrophlei]|nr:hypothetical protein SAMN05443247_00078 [Bradyrhizobium erythrophlei]